MNIPSPPNPPTERPSGPLFYTESNGANVIPDLPAPVRRILKAVWAFLQGHAQPNS
jgi:hypothetical protein